MKISREGKQMNMTDQWIRICYVFFIFKFNHADKSCFKQSNNINYLFLNDNSQMKIPLLPLDCLFCQSAYQVDIQLIDEQSFTNRTIQRIKIFLKNFEIEDSSYICLRNLCPILVEHGSDSIILNITSALFSHVFLSLIYIHHSNLCSIQTRFAIFSANTSLTCTPEIYLHPRLTIQIIGQLKISDCRAYLFEENIYQTTIQFYQSNLLTNHLQTILKSSGITCEYIFETTNYLKNNSSIQTNDLSTILTIFPFSNPWKKDIQTLGPCRTKVIPYQEMIFTADVVNIRNIYTELGQTVSVQCPIDGSEKYLKYIWYYQRYQPKNQISNNRTIIFTNITEQMQGKYMCLGNDGYEQLEFEMTLHISNHRKVKSTDTFYSIIILILLFLLILFCFIFTLVIYFSLKKSSSIDKPNAFTIHHDVLLTIQHLSQQQISNSFPNYDLYQTLDYIDDQSTYQLPSSWSWIKQTNSQQIPHRFSTRHRNVNGQLSVNIPIIQSHSDMTLSSVVKSNEIFDEKMEILKISVPLLNQYPLIKSSSSIISFNSQIELEQFNQMTSICMDNDVLLVDQQCQLNSSIVRDLI